MSIDVYIVYADWVICVQVLIYYRWRSMNSATRLDSDIQTSSRPSWHHSIADINQTLVWTRTTSTAFALSTVGPLITGYPGLPSRSRDRTGLIMLLDLILVLIFLFVPCGGPHAVYSSAFYCTLNTQYRIVSLLKLMSHYGVMHAAHYIVFTASTLLHCVLKNM